MDIWNIYEEKYLILFLKHVPIHNLLYVWYVYDVYMSYSRLFFRKDIYIFNAIVI